MAFFSNQNSHEPSGKPPPTKTFSSLNLPVEKVWLARLQTKLNSKEAELSDINRTLAATIDGASTLQQMEDAIKELSQPERETVALCALLRSGAEARMERRESDLVRLSMLSEALKECDIDLKAVALNQVVKGWPLQREENGEEQRDCYENESKNFGTLRQWMLSDSRDVDKGSAIGVIAGGIRACYLMHQCLEDEAEGQLAPLTSEAEAGFRRGLSALVPSLPGETLSGVPLFGEELIGNIDSKILFDKFRVIIEARACFDLVQIGLTRHLQRLSESENRGALTELGNYLKGGQNQSGMICQYLIPVTNLSRNCRQELIDPLEFELVNSVVNPFYYANSYALNKFRFEKKDLEDFLKLSVKRFASRLKDTTPQIERDTIQEALEQSGLDLALYEFFLQSPHETIDDDSVVEVKDQWEQLSKLLHQEIGQGSATTPKAAKRALFQSFRVQLGIYLAEIQLHQDGTKFNIEISQEFRKQLKPPSNSTTSDETNSTSSPFEILKEKAAIRTNLLEHLAEKKPCPDVIISRAVSTLGETFPLFAPTSPGEKAKLEKTISSLYKAQLQETIDSWCVHLEDRINTNLGLKFF
jgi:hypothetical protein